MGDFQIMCIVNIPFTIITILSWFGLISYMHFSNLSSSITLIIRGNLKFFQPVNLGSMPWFLVEQFKIQDLVVTLPKGWFMPNITYQTELRRHHKSPPSLRWRKFIFVLKKFKNREFWTHAGFYFFPDHLENRCQLVMPVKKGLNLSWMGWMCRFLIAFMLTKIQHEEMSTFKRFFLYFFGLDFFQDFEDPNFVF